MDESPPQIYEFDEFRVDAVKRLLVRSNGETVPLTPKVFDTLLYLLRHSGTVIDKDELMSAVWPDTIVEENNLNKNISTLRRVLGEKHGENHFIATISGRGYKFVSEVREIHSNSERSAEYLPEIKNEQLKPYEGEKIDGIPSRFFLVTLTVLCVLGLSSFGFYLWRENAKSPADAAIRTLAVLPFKPLVTEQRNEALELGMTDALISKLSNAGEMAVRPLSSVRKYASTEQDSLIAGRELTVEAVLDGTIQMWGDRVRISARLVRTGDGKQLWGGQFDEKMTDIFAIQDSISERVASALQARLTRRLNRYTDNIEAYQLYMKGRFHTLKLTPPEIQRGISYFHQAVESDPNYALAYAGLADAYRTLGLVGGTPDSFLKAKAAARKATEIDDQLAEGHAILGFIIFLHDWDWSASENELKRALSLDPNSADARLAYAHLLSNTGRHDEALAEAKRARELDPLNLRTIGLEAGFLLNAGRPDDALAIRQRVFEMDPNFWGVYQGAAVIYIDKGMFVDAAEAAKKAKELSRGNRLAMALEGYALAKSGRQEEARRTVDQLLQDSSNSSFRSYPVALVYSGLGQHEEALHWLERAYENREPGMTFLKVDRKWDNLRSEPRFIELMKRMNFDQ